MLVSFVDCIRILYLWWRAQSLDQQQKLPKQVSWRGKLGLLVWYVSPVAEYFYPGVDKSQEVWRYEGRADPWVMVAVTESLAKFADSMAIHPNIRRGQDFRD